MCLIPAKPLENKPCGHPIALMNALSLYWENLNIVVLEHNFACAVKRRGSSAGANPARQLWSLQPVAIGAAVEVTKPPEPSMQRVALRLREQAGRNASER